MHSCVSASWPICLMHSLPPLLLLPLQLIPSSTLKNSEIPVPLLFSRMHKIFLQRVLKLLPFFYIVLPTPITFLASSYLSNFSLGIISLPSSKALSLNMPSTSTSLPSITYYLTSFLFCVAFIASYHYYI
jgi:hypothetical protein